MLRSLVLISFCFLTATLVWAQDVHWSQFFDNPLYVNPANSGNFRGTSRFSVAYRDQWRKVTKPFQTIQLAYDTKWKKDEKLGLALLLLHDVSGDGKFKTSEFQVAPSYRWDLGKDSSFQLALALQLGLNQRNFTFPNFYFDEQFNGINYDPSLPITEDLITDSRTNFSLGSGFSLQKKWAKKNSLDFSVAAYNLNRPNQGFYGDKVQRDVRLTFGMNGSFFLKEHWTLLPAILFQKQGVYTEFILGSRIQYQFSEKDKDKKALYAGLFIRKKDAFYLHLGMDYKAMHFGVSYDINTSSLVPASMRRGGLELVARYVINRFRPKQIQHRICPEFI